MPDTTNVHAASMVRANFGRRRGTLRTQITNMFPDAPLYYAIAGWEGRANPYQGGCLKFKKYIAAIPTCLVLGSSMAWGQCATWTSSTIRNCNGIDYELWNQNNRGVVNMQITGGSANPNGGTFEATWNGTENILFRAGKKWGSASRTTARSIGAITLDFAATWTSSDNVKMLGIYGWAYYPAGSVPTKTENGQNANFSNQIEYYIIQDRGNYNPGAAGKKYGEATIDGIAYDFWVADRINQPMLTGNGTFKQYFSVPKSTGSHRQSGIVSISMHFEEWDKAGMKMMDCPLYEVAMKVESYSGSAGGRGSANVTRNILTLGGTSPIATRGGSLTALPVDGSRQRLREVDASGRARVNYNAMSGSKESVRPVFAY